uniref:EML-like second beta-propeller domain-containing protein n=1 Tax=Tetradesmus obliquus TaxID=3088 RepID=A0A383VWQ6_TETOB|eukprot:jgi/Sobl393_1/4051/SZX69918.1
MGESTRQRLAALVAAAKSSPGDGGAAGGGRPKTAGAYVGGFQGSLAGTWGRAATGRSGPRTSERANNPLLGGQAVRPGAAQVEARKSEIAAAPQHVRERVRPASSGAKNVWDLLPLKGSAALLNKMATQHAQRLASTRPQSAGPRMQNSGHRAAAAAAGPDDAHRVRGSALGRQRSSRAAAAASGFDSGSSFDALPGAGSTSAASFSFAGQPGTTAAAAAAAGAHAASSSFERLGASAPAAGAGAAAAADLSEGQLAALDDAIRDALRNKRSVYEDSKAVILRLFKEVDDGSGDVDAGEFCGVCAKLGVQVSLAEAAALFKRAGYDKAMPYQKWAHNLITQPSRQLAQESAVRKGAFMPGQSANFRGKIIYEECRKPVWTPSDWDPRLAERSAELPDARLQLEFVYGYTGAQSTGQCLFYNCQGQVVYTLAGLGVVYSKPPQHSQHFFLGHNDDVKSLALCPAEVQYGDQQYPARSLAATGQVSSQSGGPIIYVWDSRSPTSTVAGAARDNLLAKLQLDKEMRGIMALGFSPSGSLLAGVATDNSHTVSVWDWRNGWRLVGEGKGCMGEPPQVFGLEWNPHELTHEIEPQFATFGKKHLKVWKPAAPNGAWVATQLSFGKLPLQNVVSAAFLVPRGPRKESILAAGMADGQVYLFKGTSPMSAIAAHRPGPKSIQPDGQPAYEGLRGMRLCQQGKTLLTGGADGKVLQWDVSDGTMVEGKFAAPSIALEHPYGSDKPPVVRSLDYDEASSSILVGTLDSCIWEVSATSSTQQQQQQQHILVPGHSHDVWAVACHSEQPHIISSVCDGNKVYVWDLKARQLLRAASVGFVCRAVTFSAVAYGAPGAAAAGHHIAVGGAQGHIRVVTETELRPVWEGRDSTQGISELDYSPDGKLLAAATFDAWVDVYNVEKGYQRIARCSGHSATVRTIDWSVDSSVLQSNCTAREILYWNPRTGKQVPGSCRDTEWSGWTCLYGFPVMGIWPDTADGSDINACDRSKSSKYLVTCDDYGLVKLFNYPVVVEEAPHRAYRGHSSHVMCVRFNADDSMVCSAGGKDWALFQFRVAPVDAAADSAAAGSAADGMRGLAGSSSKKAGAASKQDMVWGPLDPAGRSYGWVPASTQAAAQPAAAGAAAVAAGASSAPQQQQPVAGSVLLQSVQQQQQPVVKRYGAAAADADEVLSEDASINDEF